MQNKYIFWKETPIYDSRRKKFREYIKNFLKSVDKPISKWYYIQAEWHSRCEQHGEVGVNGDEGPPVPIPNTVVKLIYAEDTWGAALRENRSMPTLS